MNTANVQNFFKRKICSLTFLFVQDALDLSQDEIEEMLFALINLNKQVPKHEENLTDFIREARDKTVPMKQSKIEKLYEEFFENES